MEMMILEKTEGKQMEKKRLEAETMERKTMLGERMEGGGGGRCACR